MLDFQSWLKVQDFHTFKDDIGIYTNDLISDNEFPKACEKYIIYKYLSIQNNEKQLLIFENLYDKYIHFISRRFPDEE